MIEIDAMFPVMVTANLEAVKEFYETVFGFNAVFFESSFYLHVVSPNSGVQLGFLMPNHATQPPFLHPIMSSEGYVISLEVKDAAHAYAEAQRMKLAIAMALKEEVWGQIHFMLQDPAGFRIDVVQHMATSENSSEQVIRKNNSSTLRELNTLLRLLEPQFVSTNPR